MVSCLPYVTLLLALVATISAQPLHLTVGVLQSKTGSWGPPSTFGQNIVTASEIWKDYLARDIKSFGGLEVNVNIIFEDDETNPDKGYAATLRLVQRGANVIINNVDKLCIGPNIAALESNIPIIGGLCGVLVHYECESEFPLSIECSVPKGRRFENAVTLAVPSAHYFNSFISLVRSKGAKSVAVIQVAQEQYQQVVGPLFDQYVTAEAMTMIEKVSLPISAASAQIKDAITSIAKSNPDALVIASDPATCFALIKEMKTAGFAPKAVAAFECVNQKEIDADVDLRFISGPTQWTPDATGQYYTVSDNSKSRLFLSTGKADTAPKLFAAEWKKRTGSIPGFAEAGLLASFVALETAIVRVRSVEPASIIAAINSMYEFSFAGLLSSNNKGINTRKGMLILQRDKWKNLGIVAPVESGNMQFIYPMPGWIERDVVPPGPIIETADDWLTALNLVLAVFQTIFSFGTIYTMYRKRTSPVVQASSFRFCVLILLGTMAGSWGGYSLTLEPNENSICYLRSSLVAFASVGIVAPLLAKTWRLGKIFGNTTNQIPKHTSDKALFVLVVLPLFFVTVIGLAVQFGMLDLRPVSKVELLESKDIEWGMKQHYFMKICEASSNTASQVILWVLLLVGVSGLVFTNQQATKITGAPKAFNESSEISHASLMLLIILIFLVLVNITTEDSRVTQVITSLGIQAISTIVAVVFFSSKLFALYNHESIDGVKHQSRAPKQGYMGSVNVTPQLLYLTQRKIELLRRVCTNEQLTAIEKILCEEFKSRAAMREKEKASEAGETTPLQSVGPS